MESNLQIFKSEDFGQVRTVQDNGKVLFCGSDIAKALGYNEPHKAVARHSRDGGMKRPVIDSLGRTQEAVFIVEGDVYRLIAHSKLPSAEKFERWVFDEVLPTIRKTGGYVSNEDMFLQTYLPNADEATKVMFKAQLGVIKNLNDKLERQEPLVAFANKVSDASGLIDMGRMAKLLHDEHIPIGRNKLYEWLRNKKVLMGNNVPYQQYIDGKYFQIKESTQETSYGTKTFTTTYVTGKGQIFITEKLRKEYQNKVS